MARLPDPELAVAIHGAGNREASGHMKSSFGHASSSLWSLPGLGVAIVEGLLTICEVAFDAISFITGLVASAIGAVAGAAKKLAGICSDTKGEIKAAFSNWKSKKDRIARRAEQLEAMEV